MNKNFASQWHKLDYTSKDFGQKNCNETRLVLRETHTMVEYGIVVHGIFLEILVNRNWNISKHSVEKKILVFQETVSYFTKWLAERDEVASSENISAADSTRYYIAPQTYNNLLMLV